jgi:hypothetical protein
LDLQDGISGIGQKSLDELRFATVVHLPRVARAALIARPATTPPIIYTGHESHNPNLVHDALHDDLSSLEADHADQLQIVADEASQSDGSNTQPVSASDCSTAPSDDTKGETEFSQIPEVQTSTGAFAPLQIVPENSHDSDPEKVEKASLASSDTLGYEGSHGSQDSQGSTDHSGGVCTTDSRDARPPLHQNANWRATVGRVFRRSNGANTHAAAPAVVKVSSGRNGKGTTHRRGSRRRNPIAVLPKAIDPRLQKRPSLFFRLLNRTVRQEEQLKQSNVGYQKLIPGTTGVFHWPWASTVFQKASSMVRNRTPYSGEPSPALVDELCRYFGSDEVRKQLVMLLTEKPSKGKEVVIHHPINLYLISKRYVKQEQERTFSGRPPPRSKRSFSSLREARLCSGSGMRVFNRNGSDWKLLEFSKAADPRIGDGQLSISGE